MKVVAVCTWYPSMQARTEAPFNHEHVKAISSAHSVRVVHVRLRSSAPSETEILDGVRVSRVSLDLRRPWSAVKVFARIKQEIAQADVLHTMAFSSVLMALPVWLTARLPWVHTEHWNGVTNPASVGPLWQRVAALRRVLRFPHVVTGVTTELAERLQEFARPGSATVVPCVVENDRLVQPWPRGKTLKLVAVGGLIPRKRPLLAVETMKWLSDHDHDVHLSWIGGGPLEGEVRKRLAETEMSGRIQLEGAVLPADVLPCIEAADIFFLPSEQENFFTSAAEALSAGRPVVAAAAGGYDDYCDETNSVLVREPTAENLGRAIISMASLMDLTTPTELAMPIRERFNARVVGALFTDAYAVATTRAGAGFRSEDR